MKKLRWSLLKNVRLKITRGVSFKEIVDTGKFLDIREHPSRRGQDILIYEHKGYVWAVPFVDSKESIFLKTIYPCRKLKKLYKKGVKK